MTASFWMPHLCVFPGSTYRAVDKSEARPTSPAQYTTPEPHSFLSKCNFQLPWEIKFTGLTASLKSRGPRVNARDGAVISGRGRCWLLLPALQGQFSPQPLRSDISSAIFSYSFSSFPPPLLLHMLFCHLFLPFLPSISSSLAPPSSPFLLHLTVTGEMQTCCEMQTNNPSRLY